MVHEGDALTLYPRLADGCVDFLHTDFPYNLDQSWAAGARHLETGAGRIGATVGDYDLVPFDMAAHIQAWPRILAPGAFLLVWLSDEQYGPAKALLKEIGCDRVYPHGWRVTDPAPSLFRVRFRSAFQFAVFAHWPGPNRLAETWPGPGDAGLNVWSGPKVKHNSPERRLLPGAPPVKEGDDEKAEVELGVVGQKPQWLANRAAALLGRPGGLCLDPCAGTGAILAGAAACAMRVVGAELRPPWAAEATRWVRESGTSSLMALAYTTPPKDP